MQALEYPLSNRQILRSLAAFYNLILSLQLRPEVRSPRMPLLTGSNVTPAYFCDQRSSAEDMSGDFFSRSPGPAPSFPTCIPFSWHQLWHTLLDILHQVTLAFFLIFTLLVAPPLSPCGWWQRRMHMGWSPVGTFYGTFCLIYLFIYTWEGSPTSNFW